MHWILQTAFIIMALATFIWALCKNFILQKVTPMPIKGLHIFITGGSKGIGKALALRASKEGANVTIVARNKEDLQTTCDELRKHCDLNAFDSGVSQRAQWFSADVTNQNEVEKAVEAAEAEFGPIDVLINNAGGSSQAPFEDLAPDTFEKQMRLNYLSAVYATRAVVPRMKRAKKGRIAFISSQAGQLGLFGYTAYSAAKFALRGFAEALQMELTPYDVRVTVAYPPNTLTEGFKKEQEEMPIETKKISETSGSFEPEAVAETILTDILLGNYCSAIGLDGWLLSVGTAGMAPETRPDKAAQQIVLGGILRFVSLIYLRYFDWIVNKCAIQHRGKVEKKDE